MIPGDRFIHARTRGIYEVISVEENESDKSVWYKCRNPVHIVVKLSKPIIDSDIEEGIFKVLPPKPVMT